MALHQVDIVRGSEFPPLFGNSRQKYHNFCKHISPEESEPMFQSQPLKLHIINKARIVGTENIHIHTLLFKYINTEFQRPPSLGDAQVMWTPDTETACTVSKLASHKKLL